MSATINYRVAIAGAGMVTRHHLQAWRKLPQVEVVALCARHIENARARAAEFGVPSAYGDVAEMLDRERPDVLDIATPPEAHAGQTRMAADRGIHILCQKPMTGELAASERLVADVGDRVRFMVHENWRFRPQYRQAAAWLAEGRAGPVREFQMTVRSSGLVTRTPSGRPFAIERQPFFTTLQRFLIMEVLIHHLDTVRYLVGPMSVTAAATGRVSRDIRGEDVALISLRAASGAVGTVAGNFSAAGFPPLPSDRLELVGENGTIVFESGALRLLGPNPQILHFEFDRMYQQSYDNAIAHFVACLETGAPFETDRLDNLNTLRLVADAYRRSESGATESP
jgi:predicted dehydrogenase